MSLNVFSAGSLRKALPAMADAAGLRMEVVFGPAGLLRGRIEGGARPGLFLSANMDHAQAVAAVDGYGPAQEFAGNRLCLLGRREAMICGDALAVMLRPDNRLGTSTPGADPGGDYAFSVFDRAEAACPGSRGILLAKAKPLVGGGIPDKQGATRSPVLGLFLDDRVDIFLGYRTTALDILAAYPELVLLELPADLAVRATYGVVTAKDDPEAAAALERLQSPEAMAALEQCGFVRPGVA